MKRREVLKIRDWGSVTYVTPALLAGWMVVSCPLLSAETEMLLDIFPDSVVKRSSGNPGKTVVSQAYRPSGSLWGPGLDERNVFHAEIRHEQNPRNSYALRIGKGGQLYSLRGAFGESVPPSSNGRFSPWNDEVWQFVTVCETLNRLSSLLEAGPVPQDVEARCKNSGYAQLYFIHNSGSYVPGSSEVSSFYCPMFDSEVGDDGRSVRTLNWGLVPEMKSIHRSPILYYCQTRDLGNGIIEMTWVVHNFSVRDDVIFDYMNAPWGGTRITSLPSHSISAPDGTLRSPEDFRGEVYDAHIPLRETGGWNLSSVSEEPDSPSLALVFGRDQHLETELEKARKGEAHCKTRPSSYKDWLAQAALYEEKWPDWKTRPENSFRNYQVAEVAPNMVLAPGKTIWCRSFLVVNGRDRAIEQAKSLVKYVDYGLLNFAPDTTPMVPIHLQGGSSPAKGVPPFELFSKPVPGSMPLFLIEEVDSGREVVTTDPYFFVHTEKLDLGIPETHPQHDYYQSVQGYDMTRHNSKWKRLLGYGYVQKPEGEGFVQMSSLLGDTWVPKTNSFHLDLWVKPSRDPEGSPQPRE